MQDKILSLTRELGSTTDNQKAIGSILNKYKNDANILNTVEDILQSEKSNSYFDSNHFQLSLHQKAYLDSQVTQDISNILSYTFTDRLTTSTSGLSNNFTQEINKSQAIEDLKTNGYHLLPFTLDNEIIDSIKTELSKVKFYMRNSLASISGYNPKYAESIKSNTAWVNNQQDILSIPSVQRLIIDKNLLLIANDYLGIAPIHVQTNCWWSRNYKSNKNALSANAQLFHQDKEFIKFLKVFIYLNDVNEENGAHVYIRGSHKDNPLEKDKNHQISKRLSDKEISQHFSPDQIITMNGKSGTIILEDTSGFHKGMPVKQGHRLLLQLEFANSLYFNPVPSFSTKGLLPEYNSFITRNKRFALNYSHDRYLKDLKELKRKRFVKNTKGYFKERLKTILK